MRTLTLLALAVFDIRTLGKRQCSHHAPRDECSSRGARRLHCGERSSRGARRLLCRGGITVLEVLFSIGIVAVGLLGVLTIIPVAGHRVTQGSISDHADRLGRNAVRQFDVGQMRRPIMWARFRTNDQQYVTFSPSISEPAFCIDPLFVSTQVYNAATNNTTVAQETEYFPYFLPGGAARMKRITLRKKAGILTATGGIGMGLEQAYEVFMAKDDLVFDLPDDRTLAPQQKFDTSNAKRQFDGKYTWMATVSPKDLLYPSAQGGPPRTDLCTLSIIVFYRRDTGMTMHYTNSSTEGPDPERLVNVGFRDTSGNLTAGAGIGGGNVRLETIVRQSNVHVREDLEARRGNWIMLSAKVQPNASYAFDSVFRWYRVLSTEEVLGDATNGYTRNVTLLGADWTDVIGAGGATQATLLNGVAAVYEKTIRLETSSLWTDL